MNNEELKTPAEALDEAMLNNTTITEEEISNPFDSEMTDTMPEFTDIVIPLCNGMSLTLDYSMMDWKAIWESKEDTTHNIAAAQGMMFDIMKEVDDSKRETLAMNAISSIVKLYENIGVPDEINYDLRPSISVSEIAIMYLHDSITIMMELMHCAQLYNISINKLNDIMSGGVPSDDYIDEIVNRVKDSMANLENTD